MNIDDAHVKKVLKAYDKDFEGCIRSTASQIEKSLDEQPQFGLIFGSGMTYLEQLVKGPDGGNPITIPYDELFHFPRSGVEGHAGRFVIGNIQDVPVIAMSGRKHFYEVGHLDNNPSRHVVYPIHVLGALGVPNLLATNAAGGIPSNEGGVEHKVGDVMIIKSHNALFMPNPLIGPVVNIPCVDGSEKERFVGMTDTYSQLMPLMKAAAELSDLDNKKGGIYGSVTGPSYESLGDVIALRSMGVNAVGMSTVLEIITARSYKIQCAGLSVITNVHDGITLPSHEEVEEVANSSETQEQMKSFLRALFTTAGENLTTYNDVVLPPHDEQDSNRRHWGPRKPTSVGNLWR